MRALLAVLLVAWAAPAFAECASGYTQVSVPICQQNGGSNFNVGYTTTPTGGSGNSYTAGYNFANGPYTMPQSGAVQSCSVWLASSPSGQMQCGIYSAISSSQPGTLLAASAQFTPVSGWNTVPTTSNPSVASGTSIFMGAIDTVSNQTLADAHSGFNLYGDNDSETTLQSTFLNPAHNDASTFQLGAYATFSPGIPSAPVINSSLTANGTVGTAFSYTITATNNPTSFNATSLPGGLSVNTATGVISGTPTTAATTNVGLSATNSTGTGTATLALTISGSLPPGFYVSTTGSDSNSGTLAAPFATLGKCQTAMQGSGTKICYIRAGSYTPAGLNACNSRGNCAVGLTSSDNGETWSYYPFDGIGTADITGGSTASGNGLWAIFYTGGATGVTINGLSLHNFDFAGIQSGGGANLTVTNNIIFNGFGIVGDASLSGASNAGGFMCYDCVGLTISNNVIHDIASFGMTNAHSAGLISNYLVTGNVLYNTCSQYRDCGAIYSQDLNTTKSTNLKITNNYVHDGCTASGCAPGTGGWGAGIYLDDCTNNYVITGNIVTGNNGSNNLMIHGGSNNTWSGNLIDISSTGNPVLRFQSSSCSSPTGNTFENNIIISNGAGGGYNGTSGNATVTNNAYFNYGTGTLSSSGDTNPTVEDPQLTCWAYNIASGSPVFNSPVNFPGLPGAWAYPGFSLPHTGTVPSSPHTC